MTPTQRSSSKTSKKKSSRKTAAKRSNARKSSPKASVAKKKTTRKASQKPRVNGHARPVKTAAKSSRKKSKASASKKTSNKKSTAKTVRLDAEHLRSAYRDMLRARLNDEKAITLYKQNKSTFQIGCAGHEAVQVATARAFRPGKDWFYPYYRDMGLMTGLGMTDRELMLNVMNKADDPNSHGRQMPMHYGSVALNVVNQSSPTGTQFLQATGCAMAAQKEGADEVVYVSAGEGTCSQGDFHEALNWAAREKLPIVFVIQNNLYAISVPIWEQIAGESVASLASGYSGLEVADVDGTDYEACFKALSAAHKRALAGEGPTLVEAHVPRLQSHSISDNHLKYRSEDDIEGEKDRCPLNSFRALMKRRRAANDKELEAIEAQVRESINEAATWAEQQPDPDPEQVTSFTLMSNDPATEGFEGQATGEEVFMVDALNHALHEEMERNDNMFIFGQDVAHGKGGVFTVTTGLTDAFGTERVFNAPLAEASIVGVAVGMATKGLKPVAEIQFGDYVWTGMMQIRNELAMMHYRSGGDFSCPAVLRVPIGGYIRGACYHSQNIEATFAHFPGLHVVLPSNATDAKGLLKSAIRSNNPVLFLEHKGLYRQPHAKGAEGDADFTIPLGKAKVVRSGTDLTIVSWGALVQKSLLCAEQLAKEGVSVEVIDLRTIVPLDFDTIADSVEKTSKVLIAHEDVQFMGFGAEIAAQIAENCFQLLDGPVKRVGMKYAAAVPSATILESAMLPQNDDVLTAAREVLSF